MHCQISPRRACNPFGYTMKISSLYHRLLIFDVKLTTKTDGMGSFKPYFLEATKNVTLYFQINSNYMQYCSNSSEHIYYLNL